MKKKILMVSMPSIHFFRWTEQLKNSDFEVYWFDITGGATFNKNLDWVTQFTGWKNKWNYPGRIFIKSKYPKIYQWIQKLNEKDTNKEFEKVLQLIKPEVVHSFALQISCLPILDVMNRYKSLKWIYSSWGSDIFYYKNLGVIEVDVLNTLRRVNFLITDCKRDYYICNKHKFNNKFLGVFPGNGGVDFVENVKALNQRDKILIKGNTNDIGKGLEIVKSLTNSTMEFLNNYEIIIFSGNEEILRYINSKKYFKNYNIKVINESITNDKLLELMGDSILYIGNSLSDGIPNTLIESMGMGCFPIQSNPGNVTEELIINGFNGFLISDSKNINEIKNHILKSINNFELLEKAFGYNVSEIRKKYSRIILKEKINEIYIQVFKKN
ncbi:Glycosyltransferase involved in cell wall bisynthesis [Lutibacter oricola]|uniref:Glycosyltransferase involved in cell wall bisynthesis n=1 Tax=Lutibacter oricola TaxID=762486 RepID=A0A1H2X092_9FLAO|nr:glycosyltransferase [Lutibacter oricola]SDW86178.1 Glycosyltransferase involved in cell wall bisynthesis [Lutibacter oricola]